MRRSDREVTKPDEIVQIMRRCEVLHIAIPGDNAPYLLPVSFGMEADGMTLYIHGAMQGMKYDLLEKDPRVGFEMDCTYGLVRSETAHDCSVAYESVMGWGVIDELREELQKHHALQCIMAQYHAGDISVDDRIIPHTKVLRLQVRERTAKRRR